MTTPRIIFPKWSNKLPAVSVAAIGLLLTGLAFGIGYYGVNRNLEVGYTPVQPVEYSHKLHAGTMGIDCRYCHYSVERSAYAAIPPTQTCMNCHQKVKTDSVKLLPVRDSDKFDKPIEWVKVHRLPNYVFFNHSAHLAAGVGCSTCHGRVDQMVKVSQVEPLSMGWCLDCHRNPGPALRDPSEITKMDWKPSGTTPQGPATAKNGRKVNPPLHCSGCHR